MIYIVKVIKLDDLVEEQVLIEICNFQINVFAGICPYKIKEGSSYPVEISLSVFDEYDVTKPSENLPPFTRIGEGFGYIIRGQLNGGHLKVGDLLFEDEVLQKEFEYLDGEIIALKVDRIDVEFVRDREWRSE